MYLTLNNINEGSLIIPKKESVEIVDYNNNTTTSKSIIIKNKNDNTLQKKINNLQKSLKNEKNKNIDLENEIISLKQLINDLNNNLDNNNNKNIFPVGQSLVLAAQHVW